MLEVAYIQNNCNLPCVQDKIKIISVCRWEWWIIKLALIKLICGLCWVTQYHTRKGRATSPTVKLITAYKVKWVWFIRSEYSLRYSNKYHHQQGHKWTLYGLRFISHIIQFFDMSSLFKKQIEPFRSETKVIFFK